MALTLGVAQDFGGGQPYIPVGAMLAASARARRAMEMRQGGASYKQAAEATGLTESRVRKIEGEWHREQIAQRQGRLTLD
jgi:Mor family transcriptional regulator